MARKAQLDYGKVVVHGVQLEQRRGLSAWFSQLPASSFPQTHEEAEQVGQSAQQAGGSHQLKEGCCWGIMKSFRRGEHL